MSKICKSCHCTYNPEPDEFEDTRLCQDCYEELEGMRTDQDFAYMEHSDADPGL